MAKRVNEPTALEQQWSQDAMVILRAFKKRPSRQNLDASIAALRSYQQATVEEFLGPQEVTQEEPKKLKAVG